MKRIDKPVQEPDEFVEQYQALEYIKDNLQDHIDQNDIYGHYQRICSEHKIEVSKEDDASHRGAGTLIRELTDKISECTESVDRNKEKIKKTISQTIPEWEAKVSEFFTNVKQKKYLDIESDIHQMVEESTQFKAQAQEYKQKADQFQEWQSTLDMTVNPFDEVFDVLEYCKLLESLWVSMREWK